MHVKGDNTLQSGSLAGVQMLFMKYTNITQSGSLAAGRGCP